MMVAVVEYGYYSICKAKKKKGRWFIRDGDVCSLSHV